MNERLSQVMTTTRAWALPVFLTRRNKYPIGLLMASIAALLYLSSNHRPFFAPSVLSMSFIDRWVPFVPWTVWIYLSEYFFFAVVYILTRDMVNTNKYLYSFMALQVVSVGIFFIYPTTFPRDQYPLDIDPNSWTHLAFTMLRAVDAPNNCLPSLHVSSCYLSAFIFLDEQREKFWFFFLWATAVAVTTITTKQHYFIDVAAGLAMAGIFYTIFHRFVSYRQLKR